MDLVPGAVAGLPAPELTVATDATAFLRAANERLAAQLESIGLTASATRAPHFLSVRSAGDFADDLGDRLAAAGILVSLRRDRMRIWASLHHLCPSDAS